VGLDLPDHVPIASHPLALSGGRHPATARQNRPRSRLSLVCHFAVRSCSPSPNDYRWRVQGLDLGIIRTAFRRRGGLRARLLAGRTRSRPMIRAFLLMGVFSGGLIRWPGRSASSGSRTSTDFYTADLSAETCFGFRPPGRAPRSSRYGPGHGGHRHPGAPARGALRGRLVTVAGRPSDHAGRARPHRELSARVRRLRPAARVPV